MPTKTPRQTRTAAARAAAAERRREKVRANVAAYKARAAYMTPRVGLDDGHAAALRDLMKRESVGVSDAIRLAIMRTAEKQ